MHFSMLMSYLIDIIRNVSVLASTTLRYLVLKIINSNCQ